YYVAHLVAGTTATYTLTTTAGAAVDITTGGAFSTNTVGVIFPPGTGNLTVKITLWANSKAIIFDEDTDMQLRYFIPVYAQIPADIARYRGAYATSVA